MVVLALLVGGFPDMFVSLILFGFLGLLWVGCRYSMLLVDWWWGYLVGGLLREVCWFCG